MSVYNVQELIANVERRVAQEAAQAGAGIGTTYAHDHPEEAMLPDKQLTERLEAGEFRNLRATWGVDRVPPGTRLTFLKKTLLRLLRIAAGPQATFNYNSFSATQQVAWEIDRVRQLLAAQGSRRTAEAARLNEELSAATSGLAQSRREIEQLSASLSVAQKLTDQLRIATLELTARQQRAEDGTTLALERTAATVGEIRASLAASGQESRAGEAKINDSLFRLQSELQTAMQKIADQQNGLAALKTEAVRASAKLSERLDEATHSGVEQNNRLEAFGASLRSVQAETAKAPLQFDQIELRLSEQSRLSNALRANFVRLEDSIPDLRIRLESTATVLAILSARATETEGRVRGIADRREEDAALIGSLRQTIQEVQTAIAFLRNDRSVTLTAEELDLVRTGVSRLWAELTTLHNAIEARDKAQIRTIAEMNVTLLDTARQTAREAVVDAVQSSAAKADAENKAAAGQVYESMAAREKALWAAHEANHHQLQIATGGVQELHGTVGGLGATIKELKARLVAVAEELRMHGDELDRRTSPNSTPAPQDLHGLDVVSETLRERQRRDLAYLRFQKQYRADRETLLERHRLYVPVLEAQLGRLADRMTLDVACGDGVLVELLAAAGATASGVDLNEVMVREARERHLSVAHEEALAFMAGTSAEHFDVLSAMQFIEHLPPPVLRHFLAQSIRLLKPGGVLLIETINPHCLRGLKWFHLDLTHEKLIFPEMLEILAESEGFESLGWKGINPVDAWELLDSGADAVTAANATKVNRALFGDQDYYFLARKPARKAS